jgi:hypothetical protein
MDERGDRSEFGPNVDLLAYAQVTVTVRQRITGRQDSKNVNVLETNLAGDNPLGIDLDMIARSVYRGLVG